MAERPRDACPFWRPFTEDFDGCPTFAPTPYAVRDSQHRTLSDIRSCRHLEARSLPSGQAGYYAACALGDSAARARLSTDSERRRLDDVRQLGRELGEATRELTREMWEVKGEQLRARREGRRADTQARRLRALKAAYQQRAADFFSNRTPRLRDLELPSEACVELVVGILDEWITTPSLEGGYAPSRELLERFPAPVRALATPNTSGVSR